MAGLGNQCGHSGCVCQGFESPPPDKFRDVGKLVIRLVWDQESVSSSLAIPTCLGKMKKKETVSEYDRIKKILAYMDFATKLKIAQEEGKKRRQKDSDK